MITQTPVVVLAPGHVGAGIARSLGRLGIPVYGVHTSLRSPAARSRYWRKVVAWDITTASNSESVAFLTAFGREIGGQPILMPTDDTSCLFVADNATALTDAYLFAHQPAGLARKLSSKQGMYELCMLHGVPTPATVFPQSMADVEAFIQTGRFPVMLKGIDTQALQRHSGIRMLVIETPDQLRKEYARLETPLQPNLMIQEVINGGPETLWMFNGYFDAVSHCRFGLTGKKLRQYPAYVGATSLGVCVANHELADQTKRFMSSVGYQGILDIDYKYDVLSGEYKLLDVNPRIGSSFRLFVDTLGQDVARVQYADLTGQAITLGAPKQGRKWMNELFDPVSSWTYYRDGQLQLWDWMRSFAGVEEGFWFALDDMRPLLAAFLLGIWKFFKWLDKKPTDAQEVDGSPAKALADSL